MTTVELNNDKKLELNEHAEGVALEIHERQRDPSQYAVVQTVSIPSAKIAEVAEALASCA